MFQNYMTCAIFTRISMGYFPGVSYLVPKPVSQNESEVGLVVVHNSKEIHGTQSSSFQDKYMEFRGVEFKKMFLLFFTHCGIQRWY